MINSKALAIIPARMDSTRFPGKPMAMIHGMPMIGHIYYRSKLIKNADRICVATCDREIFNYIEGINGLAVMTSKDHERATERTAEALEKINNLFKEEYSTVAMIQGDEPMFKPYDIESAISLIHKDENLNIVNIMNQTDDEEDFKDHNNVKVVVAHNGDALYYSREPIPSSWKDQHSKTMLIQTGLMVFRSTYLTKFLSMTPSKLEEIESCDMLRVLEHGDRVRMLMSDNRSIGVDSPSDLASVENLMTNDSLMKSYIGK